MSLVELMTVYQDVFHPMTVLTGCSLLLVAREWVDQEATIYDLLVRNGALGSVVALTVAGLVFVQFETSVNVWALRRAGFWELDVATSAVLVSACGLIALLWTVNGWESEMVTAAQLLVLTAVPYALISVVWNISGHVVFTLVPTLYLTTVDRRFWPLLVIPLVMVPNRPMVTAHTLEQSIGGVLLAVVCTLSIVGVRRWRYVERQRSPAP